MINTTDHLEFLVDGEGLHSAIKTAIDTAINLIEKQTGRRTNESDTTKFGFARLLGRHNQIKRVQFDRAFLEAALQFCLADSQNTTAGTSIQTLQAYAKPPPLPAVGFASLKRGLKLMLVELWRQRMLLLPTVFSPGTHFPMKLFEHPLLRWVQSFDPGANSEGEGRCNTRRLYYYGPRLLLAADWQRPEDVSLNELASLHRAQVRYSQGLNSVVIAGGAMLPFSIFAAQLQKTFPDNVTYKADALALYSVWSLTKSIVHVPFEEFSGRPKASSRKERRLVKRVRGIGVDHARVIADAARENTHEAILKAYRSLQRGRPREIDWRENALPSYPGREHVDMTSVAPMWIDTFKAFLHHRQYVREYRSNEETVASLNLLADYLFFYLPWWKQIYPLGKAEQPSSPRQFSRYTFVARHTDVPIEELPAPLLRLIALRRPSKDSASVAIHQLTRYFSFLETHFAEDERIAGRGFRSPINDDFDAPRLKKKNKTTKEIIPAQIYGHLLFYCYAVEEFGQHLQKLAVKGQLPTDRKVLRNTRRFASSEFGPAPVVRYRGKEIALDTVPNVFTWVEREINVGGGKEVLTVYMPHATVLRLLITSLETGLRCQSVQWLDRHSWDSLNKGAPPDIYTYSLLVNTDKTREHAWTTFVVHRVRALLQREQAFQESLGDANRFGPVSYEGLVGSSFDTIHPLFRAPNSAYPIGDKAYADAWVRLMVDFEAFYRDATGERHVRMNRIQPRLNADGTPVIRFLGRNGQIPYCPISVLAIHTPHACRATFATNRQGVLELSDVAALLGHNSEVVTAHYTKPAGEALQSRLRDSDTRIVADYMMFDASSDAHIRADRPESALIRSFSRDREGTLQRFRFMPSVVLWSTEDTPDEGEGLKLLREGPMSRIRFRETHICPVGEECPSDIVAQIGAPRRCGVCPLAMRCIDHLPAIAAKKNQLLERVKYLQRRRESMERSGEPSTALDEVWEELQLDINELLGWQLSEEVLTTLRAQAANDEAVDNVLHVDRPEIVRRHLERVTRRCSSAELILHRIADSNAYPTLSTPQVQAAAARLRRRLLAGREVEGIDGPAGDLEDVKVVAKELSLMMKISGLTMKEMANLLNAPALMPATTVLLTQA